MTTRAYVLTTCHRPDLQYGSTLVFDSIRVGLPNAEIVVIDQSPDPVSAKVIQEKSKGVGATYIRANGMGIHAEFIERALYPLRNTDDPLLIVDPDIVFWDELPLEYQGVIAGRYTPQFFSLPGIIEGERIHPSLWVIRSPRELVERLEKFRTGRFDFRPFHPCNVENRHYDTGAALYSMWDQGDLFDTFPTETLDTYDHLFLGSAVHYFPEKALPAIVRDAHAAAKEGRVHELKGLWRKQEEAMQNGL